VLGRNLDRVIDRRQILFGEFHVEGRADHLGYVADAAGGRL
jgi:hypothetical protein